MNKYLAILASLIIIFLSGLWSLKVAALVSILLLFFLRKYAQEEGLLLTLLLVLVLGDSAQPFLRAFKELRVLFLAGTGLFVIYDLLKGKITFNKELLHLVPLAVIACLALLRSPKLEAAIPRTISYFLLPFVLFHYAEKIMSLRFFRMLLYSAHFILWLGVLLYVIQPSYASFGAGFQHFRMNGVFGNPTGLATFSFFFFVLTLYGIKYQLLPFYWSRLHLGMLILAILLTGARAALGGVLLFTLLYLLLTYWPKWEAKQKYIYLPTALLVGAGLTHFVIRDSDLLMKRLRIFSINSFGDRWRIWKPALEQFREAPIIGKGLYSEAFIFDNTEIILHSGSSENGFLSLLLSFGIVGTAAFIYFLARQWQKFRDKTIQWPFALAVVFISCFYSWVIASLNAYLIIFYLSILVLKSPFQNHDLKRERVVWSTRELS